MRRFITAALAILLTAVSVHAAELTGPLEQGALVLGRTSPGTSVTFDGKAVRVDATGRFVIGFGRDADGLMELVETGPDGTRVATPVTVVAREWDVQRIDGLAAEEGDARPGRHRPHSRRVRRHCRGAGG